MVLDLPVDLVPPQKFMQHERDSWFWINGERAVMEFQDGSIVDCPFDPVMNLPMVNSFDHVDAAAEKLEQGLHSHVAVENNQNLSCAQKEMLQ